MSGRRWPMPRPAVLRLVSIGTAWWIAAAAAAEVLTSFELHSDYAFGYRCGVKQPLGAYKNGLSLHQITKSNYPAEDVLGDPDFVLWVDETEQAYGIHEHPAGISLPWARNPGGMVSFQADGGIWYTYGGKAKELPLDLLVSTTPYDAGEFTMVLDDYEIKGSSTGPSVQAIDPDLLLFWRYKSSGSTDARVRMRRYELAEIFNQYDLQTDIGKGGWDDELHWIGIEQLWTRYDPRFDFVMVTWQWFDMIPHRMGSNPLLYSDDHGTTWRSADGNPRTELPIAFEERDGLLVPFDHLKEGLTTGWHAGDIGVSPGGVFWLALPHGEQEIDGGWQVYLWRYVDGAWTGQALTGPMLGSAKPYALGVTKDRMVFVYSEQSAGRLLRVKISEDDGDSWIGPLVLDALDNAQTISWVSYVQPADDYVDNVARFFYSYFDGGSGSSGKNYGNNLRWIRVDTDELLECPGDVNGDETVDVLDLLRVLGAWGTNDPDADLDGSGTVDVLDLLLVLRAWGPCWFA